jgi:hypothetical protein
VGLVGWTAGGAEGDGMIELGMTPRDFQAAQAADA